MSFDSKSAISCNFANHCPRAWSFARCSILNQKLTIEVGTAFVCWNAATEFSFEVTFSNEMSRKKIEDLQSGKPDASVDLWNIFSPDEKFRLNAERTERRQVFSDRGGSAAWRGLCIVTRKQ